MPDTEEALNHLYKILKINEDCREQFPDEEEFSNERNKRVLAYYADNNVSDEIKEEIISLIKGQIGLQKFVNEGLAPTPLSDEERILLQRAQLNAEIKYLYYNQAGVDASDSQDHYTQQEHFFADKTTEEIIIGCYTGNFSKKESKQQEYFQPNQSDLLNKLYSEMRLMSELRNFDQNKLKKTGKLEELVPNTKIEQIPSKQNSTATIDRSTIASSTNSPRRTYKSFLYTEKQRRPSSCAPIKRPSCITM